MQIIDRVTLELVDYNAAGALKNHPLHVES